MNQLLAKIEEKWGEGSKDQRQSGDKNDDSPKSLMFTEPLHRNIKNNISNRKYTYKI